MIFNSILEPEWGVVRLLARPIPGVAGALYIWLGVFETAFTVPALRTHSSKTKNIVVAFMHDSGALLLSLAVLASEPAIQIGGPNSMRQLAVLNSSLGYFLADGVYWVTDGLANGKWNTRMLAHHTLCVSGIVSCWVSGRGAGDLLLGMILTHISSPFGYARYFAKELALEHHPWARACAWLYLATKLIAILILSPPVVFLMMLSRDNALVIKLCGLGILLINLAWLHTTAVKQRDYTI
jgi:hypothetical protein